VYEWAAARKAEGRPFPNIVKFSQETDHCIHPDFLGAFLTRRLERLNLAALDGFLLHNPELYLQWAERVGISLREAQRTYYLRLKEAFNYLEVEVSAGRIQFYGLSSNALTIRRDNPAFTSLSAILESGSYPHFKVLELPLNLLETDAVTQINQPNGVDSVLDTAQKAGLAVLVKRPLSARQGETRLRLVDMAAPDYPATPEDVSTAVDIDGAGKRIPYRCFARSGARRRDAGRFAAQTAYRPHAARQMGRLCRVLELAGYSFLFHSAGSAERHTDLANPAKTAVYAAGLAQHLRGVGEPAFGGADGVLSGSGA
jgi:hypothetical protein